jgi:chromosomal replication initiation ATPase DnaA
MKHTGLFENVRFLQARLDRMEAILLQQDAEIRRLTRDAYGTSAVHNRHMEVTTRALMEIAAMAAADNGLTLDELRSDDRSWGVSHTRQYAMHLMAEAGHSGPVIGRFFGRDHTTVQHGIRAARARIAKAASTE